MRYRTSDKTFNFTTRKVNKDKKIDEKWPLLFGLLEETNNTTVKFSYPYYGRRMWPDLAGVSLSLLISSLDAGP